MKHIWIPTLALYLFALIPAEETQQAPLEGSSKDYQAISLFGRKLSSPEPNPAGLERVEKAKTACAESATESNIIQLGRSLAGIGRYREAIKAYSEGLKQFPDSFLLYRHRGHRYITIRQFSKAVADFEKAAALIRDLPIKTAKEGSQDAPGTVTPSTRFDILYHYGLASYLSRDFSKAESIYRECLKKAKVDGMIIAVSDWLYLTLRRNGKTTEAEKILKRIHKGMNAGEDRLYLERLLMFKGEIAESVFAGGTAENPMENAIRDYGMGLVNLWRGDRRKAMRHFARLDGDQIWPAFAAIAAEVELADLIRADPDRTTVAGTLDAWVLSWNIYDIELMQSLFEKSSKTTYFSSEKAGRINGIEALTEHHRGFGFIAGGKTADNRLWLENVLPIENGNTAYVTADWFFDRDIAASEPVQKGPVTFILLRGNEGWKIVHAHFSNDPSPLKK